MGEDSFDSVPTTFEDLEVGGIERVLTTRWPGTVQLLEGIVDVSAGDVSGRNSLSANKVGRRGRRMPIVAIRGRRAYGAEEARASVLGRLPDARSRPSGMARFGTTF